MAQTLRLASTNETSGVLRLVPWGGHGFLADDVPSESVLANDIVLPAMAGAEVRASMISADTGLWLDTYGRPETAEDLPDGTYAGTYEFFLDGESQGTATFTVNIGAAAASLSIAEGGDSVSLATSSTFSASLSIAEGGDSFSLIAAGSQFAQLLISEGGDALAMVTQRIRSAAIVISERGDDVGFLAFISSPGWKVFPSRYAAFPSKRPEEVRLAQIDLAPVIPNGVGIAEANPWRAMVLRGDDDTPEQILNGGMAVSGSSVFQMIYGGVPETTYMIGGTVRLTDGQTVEFSTLLRVTDRP